MTYAFGVFFMLMTILGLVVMAFALFWKVKEVRQFRRDERNPYRRFCKECGAQHVVMGANWRSDDWWECQDEGCENCRRFSRDDILPGW